MQHQRCVHRSSKCGESLQVQSYLLLTMQVLLSYVHGQRVDGHVEGRTVDEIDPRQLRQLQTNWIPSAEAKDL